MKQVTQIDAVTDAVSSFFDYALKDRTVTITLIESISRTDTQPAFDVFIKINGINLLPIAVKVWITWIGGNRAHDGGWVAISAEVVNSWNRLAARVSFDEDGEMIKSTLPAPSVLQYNLIGRS